MSRKFRDTWGIQMLKCALGILRAFLVRLKKVIEQEEDSRTDEHQ